MTNMPNHMTVEAFSITVEQLARELEEFEFLMREKGFSQDEIIQFHKLIGCSGQMAGNEVYQQALADGFALAVDLQMRGKLSTKDAVIPPHVRLMADEYAARSLN